MSLDDVKTRRRRAFGKAVAALRRNRRISQEKLALNAGIDRSYVGQIERGEKSPTLDKIWQLSDALGVTPVEMFTQVLVEQQVLDDGQDR
ncbi:helix-turn-helix domain-containing protein [Bifidobacterium simiarum]|uniref:Transcriptional regulator n=1 Tax=Bifidobacterium simiarum TaxID=2045441 RepID=A0A2M9HHA8_9BIFI|nr:helix-turn-helix transcriptional regulator [Bifidobacterium simiarum]PJM76208.1 transcriptional regulator [Bifidobacterium simiarum]